MLPFFPPETILSNYGVIFRAVTSLLLALGILLTYFPLTGLKNLIQSSSHPLTIDFPSGDNYRHKHVLFLSLILRSGSRFAVFQMMIELPAQLPNSSLILPGKERPVILD